MNKAFGSIILIVYVDDILISRSGHKNILAIKEFLKSHIVAKDLGPIKYFLCIKVNHADGGLFLF